VSGKRVGIVGLGQIGAAIAKRAAAFNCSIRYWGRSKKDGIPYKYCSSLLDLAKDSDVLVVACALTDETTRIINRQVLDALGSKGYLVNIARGLIVDKTELVQALMEGRLAGAGLNVLEKEPHVPEELLKLKNVAFFPHGAAPTMESISDLTGLCVANLVAHFAGKPVLTTVLS
jgi:hydroxypyruvate reductase 2